MDGNRAGPADPAPEPVTGLMASLQGLVGSFVEILHTRAEILASEAEEAGLIIGQLVVYLLLSVSFLMLGLLLLTAFVVKASPEIYQLYVLAAFGLFYLLLAIAIAGMLKHKLETWSRVFSTTLSEMGKDRSRLGTRS